MALTLRGNGQINSDNYTIDSDGDVTIGGTLGVTGPATMSNNLGVKATLKTTHADADVVQFGGTGYLANWEDAETYLAENIYVNSSGGYRYLTNSHASLYSQTTGKHQFYVAPSGSADGTPTLTTGLEIDNDGRVVTPKVPSFMHASYSSYTVNTTTNVVMTNSNVWAAYNAGLHENGNSGWDFNTGVFTAPVAGRYFFSLTYSLSNFNSGYFWTYLQVNASSKTYHQNPQTSNLVPTTNSMVVELAANDNVRALWTNNYTGMVINYANFHGFLIG